jgi:hypothetical protein
MKGGQPIEQFQRIIMVRSVNRCHYSSVRNFINYASGSPLDSLHSLNCLQRRTIRFQVIKINKPQAKEKIMLNSCILSGNLGADPEIFYSSEGEPVATFNLAF